MNTISIISFVIATALVAVITYFIVRRMKRSENIAEEYFTGGRALSWPIIAGSLLLTNLSTEQLVGLNGSVFGDKALVGIAWESLAAMAMIVTALIFLPVYLKNGFTTTPEFLEKRFDKGTRTIVSGLFLFGYITVLLPVILYTGSLAIIGMFNLKLKLWIVSLGIGLLGSAYAIFGGLKSVAVSDTLNGIGLFIGGLMIPFLALSALGDGSLITGFFTLCNSRPEYLTVLTKTNVDGQIVSVPWPTLITGMMFIQIFYWSTNQVIVQRAMAAKSLSEGQKGVLFASFMKLIGPLMLCLPGIIALHIPELIIEKQDQVYGAIVRHVLPDWSLGLFAAVLVGSILSSFNSTLNSASTLFSFQFYHGYINKNATGIDIVRIGKLFALCIAITSVIIAPMLSKMGSIFDYLQKVNGLYSVPIIAIFLLGIGTNHIPAIAAKIGILVGMSFYAFFTFFNIKNVPVNFSDANGDLHFLHGYFISFLASVFTMFIIGIIRPRTPEEISAGKNQISSKIDLSPWPHSRKVSLLIIILILLTYSFLTWLAH
tara:strand:+ start:1129 stop:2757 length:1629 start_codon:yes stop_codon:yes gene_type:complete